MYFCMWTLYNNSFYIQSSYKITRGCEKISIIDGKYLGYRNDYDDVSLKYVLEFCAHSPLNGSGGFSLDFIEL